MFAAHSYTVDRAVGYRSAKTATAGSFLSQAGPDSAGLAPDGLRIRLQGAAGGLRDGFDQSELGTIFESPKCRDATALAALRACSRGTAHGMIVPAPLAWPSCSQRSSCATDASIEAGRYPSSLIGATQVVSISLPAHSASSGRLIGSCSQSAVKQENCRES